MVGHLVYAYFWARMAKIALSTRVGKARWRRRSIRFYSPKLLPTARFYFASSCCRETRDAEVTVHVPRRLSGVEV